MADRTTPPPTRGLLGWIERTGNALPDPVFLFVGLSAALVAVSVFAALGGVAVDHPVLRADDGAPQRIEATSLLSAANVARFWVEMPKTFTHFHPLGYVLVVMLGAGVAERTGLFGTAMRLGVRGAPTWLLTPAVALVALLSNLAADAAYVVLIPLAGVLYAAAGRHPVAGIAAAFAGVSGGFSANLLPGQLDALLFGITQSAIQAASLDAGWTMNVVGNWYFIIGMTACFLPVIWGVTDRVIEPRLGPWTGAVGAAADQAAGPGELRGLAWAGLACLGVVALWLVFTFGPGTPFVDEAAATPQARLTPLYQSLVGGFFLLFLAAGWAYGAAAGTVTGHRDIVRLMTASMGELSYYLVLAFVAAHFVAMFGWSNLGLILAVQGAGALQASGLPASALLLGIVLLTAVVNLFVGSASAKWAILAPVLVPMLMLLGVSPEMTTAAYRVGDGATNIVTPLMVYFPLILTFCQRWEPRFGLGSLAATMLPYSLWLLVVGGAMTVGWVVLDLPLGPGAEVTWSPPGR